MPATVAINRIGHEKSRPVGRLLLVWPWTLTRSTLRHVHLQEPPCVFLVVAALVRRAVMRSGLPAQAFAQQLEQAVSLPCPLCERRQAKKGPPKRAKVSPSQMKGGWRNRADRCQCRPRVGSNLGERAAPDVAFAGTVSRCPQGKGPERCAHPFPQSCPPPRWRTFHLVPTRPACCAHRVVHIL